MQRVFLSVAIAAFLAAPAGTTAERSDWEWDGVARVVAMGDVHGRRDQLVSILRGTGLVDDRMNWTGGRAHLIFCGDLVDRGPEDRAVLDIVRALQKQAESAGGRVHAVLGNHEVMNLVRDFRYVSEGGFAAFARDERPDDRKDAGKAYPAGYFARQNAFSARGEYGRWLLDQPAMVKVNGILFMHGGLTAEVAGLGLDRINSRVKDGIRSAMRAEEALADAMGGAARFADFVGAAQQLSQPRGGQNFRPELTAVARNLLDSLSDIAFAPDGPLWYRGISLMNERVERYNVTEALQRLGARGLMVGHTITKTSRISTRFGGRVYRGDVGMGAGRPGQALVFENDQARVFDAAASGYSAPLKESPTGEGWAGGYEDLPDNEIEDLLRNSSVGAKQKISRPGVTAELWELERKPLKLRAVFKDVDKNGERYQHEIAAFRLDRRLGLDFVPVAIERKVDRRTGALRAVSEQAIDVISMRSELNLEGAQLDAVVRSVAEKYGMTVHALEDQVLRARVFDGLAGVLDRQEADALFIPESGRVALMNHSRAFGTTREIRPMTLQTCRPLPADLLEGLVGLNREGLTSDLGSYLTREQIDALLARRDRLVEACK